jgi:hypothetical protein
MLPFATILADVDEGAIKLIFFVIVAIIWGIGAMISAVKKKAEQMRKAQMPVDLTPRMEQQQGVLRRDQLPVAPAVWPPPPPALGQTAPVRQQKKNRKGPQKPPVVARPVPPPLPVAAPSPAMAVAASPIAATAPAARPAVGSVSDPTSRGATRAASVRNLLRAPALPTLIVISEVLGKPLALRDDPPVAIPPQKA